MMHRKSLPSIHIIENNKVLKKQLKMEITFSTYNYIFFTLMKKTSLKH